MRLLLLNYSLHAQGGSQMTSLALAESLHRRGHEVHFGAMAGPLVQRLVSVGIPFIDLPSDPRRPDLHTMTRDNVGRIAEILQRERIDLVHSFQYFPALAAVVAAVRRPTPITLSLLGPKLPPYRLSPRIARIFVVSEELREKVNATRYAPANLVAVVPNRVDLSRFRTPDAEPEPFEIPGVTLSGRLIGSVSTLTESKATAVRHFLEAARRLAPTRPDLQFIVAGDGPAREELQLVADEANASIGRKVIILTGTLDIPQLLPHLDVLVGMGRSALEALAAGRPTVMLGPAGVVQPIDSPSLPWLMHSNFTGRGRPIPADPAGALAEAIVRQLEDPEAARWSATEGRSFIFGQYDAARGAEILESHYGKILETFRPGTRIARMAELSLFFPRVSVERLWRRGVSAWQRNSRSADQSPVRAHEEQGET